MLGDKKLKAFIPTRDTERAKKFYRDVLGLKLLSEDNYALLFDAGGTMLRITRVDQLTPQPFTVLGWEVGDLNSLLNELGKKGVKSEIYSFMEQDDLGIWTSPGGSKVAWFKDLDGNLLSLTQ
jgi:catechol 2,3-dioxygenase-like lactoylglutathione lyase family enzyme